MTEVAKAIEPYSDEFVAFRHIEPRMSVDLMNAVLHHCNLFENTSSASKECKEEAANALTPAGYFYSNFKKKRRRRILSGKNLE